MNEIGIDGGQQKICRNCVDEIRGRGKSEKLKKLGDITLYGTYESEEDAEEVEGTVIGCVWDEVSVMPIVYPCGTVSVSSLGYFVSVGSSSKTSHPSVYISIGVNCIQQHFNKKRGRNQKYIKPQEKKARHEQQMQQMRLTVQAKFVVVYWELVPMESGSDNS